MKYFSPMLLAILMVVLSAYATAQRPPLCDVDCSPDPGSGNYSWALAARVKRQNARGYASRAVPKTAAQTLVANGPSASLTVTLIGSQSYNYSNPILRLPGRAGMDLNLSLYYNSRTWNVDTVNSMVTFNADRDFPSYGFRLDLGYLEYDSADDQYILTEPDGTKRGLPNTSSGYQSNDGSFIAYTPTTKKLFYRTGTAVQFATFPSQIGSTETLFRPVSVKDANGNYLSITYVSGHDQFVQSITDTLGRVIQYNYDQSNHLISITQTVQPSSIDPSGIHTYVTFTWGTASLNYAFAAPFTATNSLAPGSSISVITGCTYANGTGYRFTYGDWGIVTKIETLSSTGATRSYVSYNFPPANPSSPLSDAPAYTQETVSPDGTTANAVTWTYSASKNGTGNVTSMTVTDPNLNKTVTNLEANGRISSVQMQSSSSAALRTIAYTWTTVGASASPLPSNITATINDTGQQASIQYNYDSNGNAIDVYEYDFNNQVKRHTVSTFATGSYLTQHILNLPTQVLVKDAGGNIQARTDFAYDSTSFYNSTDITASNHDNAAYGVGFTIRGILTSVTRYTNASSGTGQVIRTYTFDSLGNVRSAQLDCCNQKTFNLSSTTQFAYPDSIVRGPSGGPHFTVSQTYNIDKGLVLTRTDENAQTTSYQYDSMNRVILTSPPSSAAHLNVSFGDDAVSPTVTTFNTFNSLVAMPTFDGLGRLIRSDDKNITSPISSVIYTYDGTGQRTKASNPFAPGGAIVYTNFSYDGVGRITQISPPSGGLTQYQYSGNAVTITDPAGKQRKNVSDALGRLIEVMSQEKPLLAQSPMATWVLVAHCAASRE